MEWSSDSLVALGGLLFAALVAWLSYRERREARGDAYRATIFGQQVAAVERLADALERFHMSAKDAYRFRNDEGAFTERTYLAFRDATEAAWRVLHTEGWLIPDAVAASSGSFISDAVAELSRAQSEERSVVATSGRLDEMRDSVVDVMRHEFNVEGLTQDNRALSGVVAREEMEARLAVLDLRVDVMTRRGMDDRQEIDDS